MSLQPHRPNAYSALTKLRLSCDHVILCKLMSVMLLCFPVPPQPSKYVNE